MARRKQFAVIGLGRFGWSIAVHLAEQGAEVLAIDRDEELVDAIADKVGQAVATGIGDKEKFAALGLAGMDGIVVAMGEEFESVVLLTALAKENELPLVVARAYDDIQNRILKMVGADQVINPEQEMGARLARSLTEGDVVDFIDLPDGFHLREIKIRPKYEGQPLSKLLEDCDQKAVAVRLTRELRNTAEGESGDDATGGDPPERIALPDPGTILHEGDALALIGAVQALERL